MGAVTAAATAMAVMVAATDMVTAILAAGMVDTMAEDSPFTVRFRGATSTAIALLPDAAAGASAMSATPPGQAVFAMR